MTSRRNWFIATAAAAAVTGIGTGWWRGQKINDAASAGTPAGDGAATPDIWSMRFATPTGGELALSALRGRPLLLNFWATWCAPCVSELPLIDGFHRDQRDTGMQVVGLAVDNLAPVRDFLAKRPVAFPIGLAGADGVALSRRLGNAQGALPFSVVFDRDGKITDRRLGVIQAEDLTRWAAAH